ncbi:TetR/AcrR family transcriptional regulator [Pendulispora brunnea]|uniref:TetR/AcrR family transcriptional regulator n=1 Tax=Pendulispora brunnea TaxID=2905690 RepID=A0ABZ2JUV5_9BACT
MPRIVRERQDVIPALAEVFREHGFEGASLSIIGERTGLGKGSLYHFFPGGKDEMAAAVLADVSAWFEGNMFEPLRSEEDPRKGLARMLTAVETYFQSGMRICLVGAFALGDARDRFAETIHVYFAAWRDALARTLVRTGLDRKAARERAEEIVATIQGAIVLARALDDPASFRRAMRRIRAIV